MAQGLASWRLVIYALTLIRARDHLDAFQAEGRVELLHSQLVGKELMKHPKGKPRNTVAAEAVRALKPAGFSQADTADGLSGEVDCS
ncbi:hypothetical protein D3C85_1629370 [compost metagenome]